MEFENDYEVNESLDESVDTEELSFEEMYEQGRPGDEEAAESYVTDKEQPAVTEESGQAEQPWKTPENAAYAQQRRQQELQEQLQAERDRLTREFFGSQTNPYTGEPIRSYADYQKYQQQYQQEQLEQAGITQEQLDQIVQQNPQVQQAQQIIQQNQQYQQEQQILRGKQLIDEDVKVIGQYDPSVRTFDDIRNHESFEQVQEMMSRGYLLRDAYRIANMDRIMQRKQTAAKQQVINQTNGKRHMQATGNSSAGDSIEVPSDVLNAYREMMPNATTKEIRAHYQRMMKKGR